MEANPSSTVSASVGVVEKAGRFTGPFARTRKALYILYAITGGLVLGWLILGATAWRGFLGQTTGTALAADAIRVIGGLLFVIDLIACTLVVQFRRKKMFLGFAILVLFFSLCVLVTWCLDAYNATVESGLIAAGDPRFILANDQYSIYPITVAACIVGAVLWLLTIYVFVVSIVVHRMTYDDLTAGIKAPKSAVNPA